MKYYSLKQCYRCQKIYPVGLEHSCPMSYIPSLKAVYCDVDDTLVMMDLSSYPEAEKITLTYVHGPVTVVKNQPQINFLEYLHKLGWEIYIWSKTGADWAELVGKSLELPFPVKAYLPKPMMYVDDQDVSDWIGKRRWRDAK